MYVYQSHRNEMLYQKILIFCSKRLIQCLTFTESFGIHGIAILKWIESFYLTESKELYSVVITLHCDVPQGSVLGPLSTMR